jgi:predicted RecB family endonuclease
MRPTTVARRSRRAARALAGGAYQEIGMPYQLTDVVDVLADLEHFCAARNWDFASAVRVAHDHFVEETS